MNFRLPLLSRALLLAAAVGSSSTALAQEAAPEVTQEVKQDGSSRILGDHLFLYPTLMDTALITSYVGIREAFAILDVPNFDAGALGEKDITLSGFQQTIDLALQFGQMVGIAGYLRGTVLTGIDQASVIIDGASVNYELAGNVAVRLYRNDSDGTQLTVRGGIGYKETQEVTVLRFVEGLVAEPTSIVDVLDRGIALHLLVPTSETGLRGGLQLAQAFSKLVSLQAVAGFEYAWFKRRPFEDEADARVDQDGNLWIARFGGALTLDFNAMKVPVAALGEYQLLVGDRTGSGALPQPGSSTFGLGVYYSGRPALQVGVGVHLTVDAEAQAGEDTDGNISFSDRPTLTDFHLIMRYTW